jgi:hypothetical protein
MSRSATQQLPLAKIVSLCRKNIQNGLGTALPWCGTLLWPDVQCRQHFAEEQFGVKEDPNEL